MFCPKCKYEYRPEITKCPDCDTWLVKELPPDPIDPEEQAMLDDTFIVTIFATYDLTKFQIAKTLLEEAKIEYFSLNKMTRDGSYPPIVGPRPHTITINQIDLERAREILLPLVDEGDKDTFVAELETDLDEDDLPEEKYQGN